MARRVKATAQRSPRARLSGEDRGYFYPAEVVTMLRLDNIDYAQLRRLFALVRHQSGEAVTGGAWARFSLQDLAALEILIELCGGRESLARGRRLRLANIRDACEALRQQGYTDPLLQIPMRKVGRRVYALVDGVIVDPASGQQVLAETLTLVERFLAQRGEQDPGLLASLERESSNYDASQRVIRLAESRILLVGPDGISDAPVLTSMLEE